MIHKPRFRLEPFVNCTYLGLEGDDLRKLSSLSTSLLDLSRASCPAFFCPDGAPRAAFAQHVSPPLS
jgi:hypothetical protein